MKESKIKISLITKVVISLGIVLATSFFIFFLIGEFNSIPAEGKVVAKKSNKQVNTQQHEKQNETSENLRLKGKTIVIDPGHGGTDRGATGKKLGTIEKDLNLKVAKNIKKELEERTDIKVILTRENDTSLLPDTKQKEELQARVKVAEDHSADLYISIHHDAFEDTNVKGLTIHYGANKRRDKELAKIVQEAIFNQNIDTRDRGVQGSDYFVLRENPSPAILIELGFTSNESDEIRMNSEEFQVKTTKGIVDGIINYFALNKDEKLQTRQKRPDGKPPVGKVVYLTFDDGPSTLTGQFLDVLKEQNVKATFFMQGSNLQNTNFQENVIRAVDEEHYIGAHSMTHYKEKLYKKGQFVPEMQETIALIHDITGTSPKLVRPPYGSVPGLESKEIRNQIVEAGLKVWDWTIDSNDWALKDNPNQIIKNVINQTTEEVEVVLMHENPQTLIALPEIITFYKEQGYEFGVYNDADHFRLNFRNYDGL